MFYTIYKITNLIDGKIYIGKHQTKDLDDGYMGSGKQLKRAQNKHGIENFKKEILFQFDNEADMNAKEVELVTEEFCLREDTYNLCPGGKGGWGYVNQSVLTNDDRTQRAVSTNKKRSEKIKANVEYLSKLRNLAKSNFSSDKAASSRKKSLPNGTFYSKSHSENTKLKIGEANRKMIGSKNSQFGTIWITNGQENKKIKKDVDIIPEGWYKGRINKLMP
jgi:hypothetical protein